MPPQAPAPPPVMLVDFNSFFASVEQMRNPKLRGRPVGVIPVVAETTCCIAASVEAKQHGVRTGTRVADARRLCPDITFVLAEHARYVQVHHAAIAIIDAIAPVEKILSIDEMLCSLPAGYNSPARITQLAQRIKAQLAAQLAPCMRVSIGIAPNQLLAKLASDMHKPDGLTFLHQHELPAPILHLPISALCGIGANMERRLHARGIRTMAQLYAASRSELRAAWGSVEGEFMHSYLHCQPAQAAPTQVRSLGHSHVLPPAMRNPKDALAVLDRLLQKAAMRLRKQGYFASALHIFIRPAYADAALPSEHPGLSRDCHLPQTQDTRLLLAAMQQLWFSGLHLYPSPLHVGLTLHGLVAAQHHTPDLFASAAAAAPQRVRNAPDKLLATLDALNRKFPQNKIVFGGALEVMQHAPMRIAFNRIPDIETES